LEKFEIYSTIKRNKVSRSCDLLLFALLLVCFGPMGFLAVFSAVLYGFAF